MSDSSKTEVPGAGLSGFIQAAGYILLISYPVLALSTGFRAVFRLFFKDGITDYLPAALSLIAACFYLVATIGFWKKTQWAWGVSIASLGLETLLTLVIGALSVLVEPNPVGNTVWRQFGADYGYLPLIQPVLGLLWLLHPATLRAYRLRSS